MECRCVNSTTTRGCVTEMITSTQRSPASSRRGEPLSEDQYQEELAKLMVQDDSGVFWSLEPGTGRWLYFNGTEWMPGTPPRQAPPRRRRAA